ncbi:MAG: tetratricopeptide repeat protein [Pseudomonadota bacterium]
MVTWRVAAAGGCLLAAVSVFPTSAAEPGETRLAALTEGAPPRTVNDITGVLGAYKPDAQKFAAAKAAADRQPPVGQSDAALAEFYHARGVAAGEVGRFTQQLADLRQALTYAEKAGADRSRTLQLLMQAEAQVGNFANAIRYAEERADIDDRRGARGRLYANYAALVRFNIRRGDLAAAERWVQRSKDLYGGVGVMQPARGGGGGRGAPRQAAPTAPGDSNRSLSQPSWRASVASARARLLVAQGRYRPAEASLRTAVEQSNEFLANLPKLSPGADIPAPEYLQNNRNQLLGRLAEALALQGKLVEAEVESRNALVGSLQVVGRYHTWTGAAAHAAHEDRRRTGARAEAEQLARAAMAIYEAIDASQSWGIASAHQLLGDALVSQGRWTDAAAAYDAMMASVQGDDAGIAYFGFGELDWVTALVKTGRAEPAVAMATRLLERRRQTFGEQHPRTALTRAYLGLALAAGGRREPALQAFRDALPILLAAVPGTPEGPSARAQRLALLLDAYIRLLADIRGTPSRRKPSSTPRPKRSASPTRRAASRFRRR